MRLERQELTIALAVALSLAGCSTRATVTRVNGNDLSVKFAGSDSENVYIRTRGETHAIPRSGIADIDHPGDTAAVIGGILTGYGVLNIAAAADRCEVEGAAFCAGVFLPATVGVSMLMWGLTVHRASVEELERRVDAHRPPKVRLIPSVIGTDQGALPGAVIEGRF